MGDLSSGRKGLVGASNLERAYPRRFHRQLVQLLAINVQAFASDDNHVWRPCHSRHDAARSEEPIEHTG